MSGRVRGIVLAAGIAAVAVIYLVAAHGIPAFGHYRGPYGDILNATAPRVRQVANVVSAVNYDYRGLDTLGEEFILFTAVAGVALILRERHDETDLPEDRQRDRAIGRFVPAQTEAVRAAGFLFFGLTVLFALYVILHGHLTPGGGFQGGSILASAWALAYLAGSYHLYHKVSPQTVSEGFDSLAAGAYALIGLATLATGAAFLQNVLPYGQLRNLLSAGTIDVINCAVGIEVAAAFVVVFGEFLKQLVAIRERGHVSREDEEAS